MPQPLVMLMSNVPVIMREHAVMRPVCFCPNNVDIWSFAASVCLATGSSPMKSTHGTTCEDLAGQAVALVVNMSSLEQTSLTNHFLAISAHRSARNPTLLNLIGAASTTLRKSALKQLLFRRYFDVILGDEGEFKSLFDDPGNAKTGVDSKRMWMSYQDKLALVKSVARWEQSIVLMTGPTLVLSDGSRTLTIENGHSLLDEIAGGSCCFGHAIASYLAAHPGDKFSAAMAGILHYQIAGERAARREHVMGPGTFAPAFIDQLYALRREVENGSDGRIKDDARVGFE